MRLHCLTCDQVLEAPGPHDKMRCGCLNSRTAVTIAKGGLWYAVGPEAQWAWLD